MPALGLAGEAKVGVADDILVGTGKSDFAANLIAGKELGGWDVHGNLGYKWVGRPTGVQDPAGNPVKVRLNDFVSFSLGFEQKEYHKLQFLAEVLGNLPTPFQKSGNAPENPITPEASCELVGTICARYFFRPHPAFQPGFQPISALNILSE